MAKPKKSDIRNQYIAVSFRHRGKELSLVTSSSNGQSIWLANMGSKINRTSLGSRIVEVHIGTSLFTGDTDILDRDFSKN